MSAGLEALLLRLLVLHETVVSYAGLGFEEVIKHAQGQVAWVFDGAELAVLPPDEALGLPGRGRVPGGYGAYFPGPPRPLYLRLTHPRLGDPLELRLAALYLDYLLSALKGAGYREELERQARNDWLTGLGNRRALERRLEEGLPAGWGLALLDLDNLKRVNDTAGHLAGDRLLVGMADALRQQGLEAFRVGGDEFAVLLPRRRLAGLRRTAREFNASLGVAWAEEGAGEALLRLADGRMYAQKRRRKGRAQALR